MTRVQERELRSSSRTPRPFPAFIALVCLGLIVPPNAFPSQETYSTQINDYRIGAKDLIEIKVFELPDMNQTVRVSEDGSISMSLLGRVEVAGLTAQQLERKLALLLEDRFTKGGAHVTVFIREFQKVAVIGAVSRPGMYELAGPTTVLMVIAQAGGLTGQAAGDIFIYRQSPEGKQAIIPIRLEDLASGKQEFNMQLEPKDVISIPIDQVLNVFVYGEVRTPGLVPYLNSKKITLLQAVAQAGGPTEWAKKTKVTIKRKDKGTGKEMKIRVNLKSMISGKIADIFLEEGDVVIVP